MGPNLFIYLLSTQIDIKFHINADLSQVLNYIIHSHVVAWENIIVVAQLDMIDC